MRTVRYSVAASLDGFIAGPGGEYDWIPEDTSIDFGALYGDVDTLLMGRKTWEVVLAQGDTNPLAKMTTVLFSATAPDPQLPHVTVVRAHAAEAVRALKAQPGGTLWLYGGGALFASLLDAGVVDEVEVGLCPNLLGSGIPLLPATQRKHRLRLLTEKRHESGIMMLRYAVDSRQ
jgi:dihydrofolate reductase